MEQTINNIQEDTNNDIISVKYDLNFEGLYLIHIRECIVNNTNVYKIGRSNNIYARIHQYPNASIAYLVTQCPDSKKHEKELIKLFCSKYTQRKFYGEEYFEGDRLIMINDIIKYINALFTNIKICIILGQGIIFIKLGIVGG
jgi:uncharacterized Fe-S cluster protein YjdI